MKITITLATFILALLAIGAVNAQDGDQNGVAYFRSRAFNVPILAGWEDQSTETVAQFHLAEAGATIRTAIVPQDDILAAAGADLRAAFGVDFGGPGYQDKVNLADGTWTVLIYEPDARISASVMARHVENETVVISFVESAPAGRILMLAVARSDESEADASGEIDAAAGGLLDPATNYERRASLALPSGEWMVLSAERYTAMGMVFGNDSFLALAESAAEQLPALADAYNRTLLGFFITPDNSTYLALGLAAAFIILGTLVGSLFWRERALRKDLALLQVLAGEDG
ncbi:MAG: hypothetical protein OXN88_18085 [Chloroflexota bacterium]|nr:hypothetical protein [Chloroflexota bacterium]